LDYEHFINTNLILLDNKVTGFTCSIQTITFILKTFDLYLSKLHFYISFLCLSLWPSTENKKEE